MLCKVIFLLFSSLLNMIIGSVGGKLVLGGLECKESMVAWAVGWWVGDQWI